MNWESASEVGDAVYIRPHGNQIRWYILSIDANTQEVSAVSRGGDEAWSGPLNDLEPATDKQWESHSRPELRYPLSEASKGHLKTFLEAGCPVRVGYTSLFVEDDQAVTGVDAYGCDRHVADSIVDFECVLSWLERQHDPEAKHPAERAEAKAA